MRTKFHLHVHVLGQHIDIENFNATSSTFYPIKFELENTAKKAGTQTVISLYDYKGSTYIEAVFSTL